MKKIIFNRDQKNVIVTTVIGGKYLDDWKNYALPYWMEYCKRNNIGLIAFDEEIIYGNLKRSLYWQKLLVGIALKNELEFKGNVCYVDSDVLINPLAPNIFDGYQSSKIGLISQKKNLPYPLLETLKRIAYFRKNYIDSRYPLDSYLFSEIDQVYALHKLPPQNDIACTGIFLFNNENHAELLLSWYKKYNNWNTALDGGTEEIYLNYEIQANVEVDWLDYKFQALWMYEMAWKYPFLYKSGVNSNKIYTECIESSLYANYFLHFAGRWEGDAWKNNTFLEYQDNLEIYAGLSEYIKVTPTGSPKGVIHPDS